MIQGVLKTNLRVSYVLSFLGEIYFPTAIWLYFWTHYLNFKEIALLSSLGYIASIVFEVPTGAFADLVGRKIAIVISYFIFSITMLLIGFSHTFNAFLILIIIGALGDALYSGSLDALVYDSLKENGEESHFPLVTSKMQTYIWLGLFLGSIVGGYLYVIWFRLPYIAQAVTTCIGGIYAMKLVEPKIDSKKYHISEFVSQNTQGFREIFKDLKIAQISIVLIIIGVGYQIGYSILGVSQAKQYGIEPQHIGILFAVAYLVSALASHFYPKMKQQFGSKLLIIFSLILLLTSFFFAKFAGIFIGAFLIFLRIASSTTFRNTRSIQINAVATSQNRATALSTINLLTNLPFAIFAYFIGDYIDKHSPNDFAFVLGAIILFVLLAQNIVFSLLRRRSRMNHVQIPLTPNNVPTA